MNIIAKNIYKKIDKYYTNKIKKYGTTSQGVDWKDEHSHIKRFEQLIKVINIDNKENIFFSIDDLGCGYGKLYEYLKQLNYNFEYYGYDISKDMIKSARITFPEIKKNFIKICNTNEIQRSTYTIASGIFNVKLHFNESEWLYYILHTLEIMHEKSIKGFSFNLLTKYSDKEFIRDDLYYADPLFLFDYCKKHFSNQVALLHDYGLYEFTIIVRK